MTLWLQVLCGLGALILVAALTEAWCKRGRHRRLSDHQPPHDLAHHDVSPHLGLEATDLKSFDKALAMNDHIAGQSGVRARVWSGRPRRIATDEKARRADQGDHHDDDR